MLVLDPKTGRLNPARDIEFTLTLFGTSYWATRNDVGGYDLSHAPLRDAR